MFLLCFTNKSLYSRTEILAASGWVEFGREMIERIIDINRNLVIHFKENDR